MKRTILSVLTLIFLYITLTSNSAGIAQMGMDRTGAGGNPSDCAGSGCHDPNNSDLSLSILLIDPANGDTIKSNKYQVGKIYRVELYGNYSLGGLPKFGFQCTAVAANGNGAGDFIPTMSGVHNIVVGPYQIVEQSHSLDATGSFQQRYVAWFNWYPSANYGDVTFHATLLAANDDGFVTGDITNNEVKTFQAGPLSVGELGNEVKTSVYPNPVKDRLTLSIDHAPAGKYSAEVCNLQAQVIARYPINITSSSETALHIDAAAWPAGVYLIKLASASGERTIRVLKQ